MMLKTIQYKLRLAGDLHIGSGVGLPGIIDEYVVRDHDNLPQVLGSEIKGMVRDSCVRLLKYQNRWDTDDVCSGQKQWHEMSQLMQGLNTEHLCGFDGGSLCILCALFGSPVIPGGWWFSPATYGETYRSTIKEFDTEGHFRLAYRDMQVNAQASIDPETKRAEEDHLFNLEVVRTSHVWKGTIDPVAPSGNIKKTVSGEQLLGWLTAALLFTRRIGGRRRKGWGRCQFVLNTNDAGNAEAVSAVKRLFGGES